MMAAVTSAKPTKVGSAGRSRRNVAAYSSGSSATRCASSTPPAATSRPVSAIAITGSATIHQVRAGATAVIAGEHQERGHQTDQQYGLLR